MKLYEPFNDRDRRIARIVDTVLLGVVVLWLGLFILMVYAQIGGQ